MNAELEAMDQHRTVSPHQKYGADARPAKLIDCPFEVRIDGALHDSFYNARDAMASARTAKRNMCGSTVVVTDVRTEKLVIEVES